MSPSDARPESDYGHANGWDAAYPDVDPADLPAYVGPHRVLRPADDHGRRGPPPASPRRGHRGHPVRRPGELSTWCPVRAREPSARRPRRRGEHSLALDVGAIRVLDVVDAGDADIIPAWPERGHAMAYRRILDVMSSGAVPIVLGGDHSITWPVVSAVAQTLAPRRVGMIHFDAHADTADDEGGVRAGHGTPMRRLIESGALAGEALVQVGLRGYWPPPATFDWMRSQGMRWHLMREIEERGVDAVIDDAIREVMEHADVVYISVDIDVVDPAWHPGPGTPEPGGMLSRELLRAVRRIATSVDIAGMDVMEVAPPYDHAEVTAMVAHRCVLETLSGMAVRRQTGRVGGPPAPPWPAARRGRSRWAPGGHERASRHRSAFLGARAARPRSSATTRPSSWTCRAGSMPIRRSRSRSASGRARVADVVEAHGYAVERGAGTLPTAIRGVLDRWPWRRRSDRRRARRVRRAARAGTRLWPQPHGRERRRRRHRARRGAVAVRGARRLPGHARGGVRVGQGPDDP